MSRSRSSRARVLHVEVEAGGARPRGQPAPGPKAPQDCEGRSQGPAGGERSKARVVAEKSIRTAGIRRNMPYHSHKAIASPWAKGDEHWWGDRQAAGLVVGRDAEGVLRPRWRVGGVRQPSSNRAEALLSPESSQWDYSPSASGWARYPSAAAPRNRARHCARAVLPRPRAVRIRRVQRRRPRRRLRATSRLLRHHQQPSSCARRGWRSSPDLSTRCASRWWLPTKPQRPMSLLTTNAGRRLAPGPVGAIGQRLSRCRSASSTRTRSACRRTRSRPRQAGPPS